MKKRIISLCLSAILVLSNLALANAEQKVEVSIVEKPNIDILLTTGSFSTDITNLEKDIKEALQADGFDTSGIEFQTISTSVTSSSAMSASTILNDWGRIGVAGNWTLSTAAAYNYNGSGQSIYNSVNTSGLTGFYCKDNYKIKNMTIEYDIKTTDTDNDAVGVFLRLNLTGGTTEETAALNKKVTTYLVTDSIGSDTHYLPDGLYKVTNQIMPKADSTYSPFIKDGSYVKLQAPLSTANKLKTKTWFHYKYIINKNNIKVYRGPSGSTSQTLIIDYTDANPIEAGTFGLTNWSQPSAFANFVATCEVERDYKEILLEPTWRSDAVHMIVNVDSTPEIPFFDNPEILTRTLADDIHFIQWGTDENKQASENFIEKNENKGIFTLGSEQQDYNTAIQNTVDYIESLFQKSSETQYVIVNRNTDLEVNPASFKTNAVNIEFPDGRWIVHHNYSYFANNLGQSMQTEYYTPNLSLNFDKPGAYDIYFDDVLIKTVYAHRLPTASFDMNISGANVSYNSTSFDEDDTTDIGYGSGIKTEKWSYKEVNDVSYTEGKLENLVSGKNYIVKLEVEDFQGAKAYTTKYVGIGSPVSYFTTDKQTFSKFYNLKISDASYDPAGLDITEYKYELKQGKTVLATYTQKEPQIDFQTIGAGEYVLSLTVKNSQNVSSESYSRSITVIDDNTPPQCTISPTFCDWQSEVNIDIKIEDKESGLKNWRYCYTQSQAKPSESEWGSFLTTASEELLFNTDGEYYLHIEAFDNANNKLERTVGSYKITHPYKNEVSHNFNLKDFNVYVTNEQQTYDWGKWYSPAQEFKMNIDGFELTDTFYADGVKYNKEDRIKQPSKSMDFSLSYQPVEYSITYNYNLDCEEVDNPDTYTVLDKVVLNNPEKEGYTFMGWYLNDKLVSVINPDEFNAKSFITKTRNSVRQTGNITLNAKWIQEEYNNECMVYAEIGSDFKVKIPKTIVLSGSTKSAIYNVEVTGDIAGTESISVVPESSILLHTTNKASIEASVSQDKTNWAYDDLGLKAAGSLSAPALSAGKWSNKLNFTITFDSKGYKNSEEKVEYHTLTYPEGTWFNN